MSRQRGLWVGVAALALAAAGLAPALAAAAARDTLMVGAFLEPDSLDPHVAFGGVLQREIPNMYEPLVDLTPDGSKVIPILATSWDVTDQASVYTFRLRPNVKFSDGTPFNAAAVKYSVERALALKKTASSFVDRVRSVETPDDLTVRFRLATSFTPFLPMLKSFFMVSPTAAKAKEVSGDWGRAWLNERSAGTGPYVAETWSRGNRVTFVRNEHYWRGWSPGQFARVVSETISEPEVQRLKLERGDLDIAMKISADAVPFLQKNPEIHVQVDHFPGQQYVFMNTRLGPLKDLRVRRAVAHAWNVEAFRKLMTGNPELSDGPTPREVLGGPGENPYEYNLDKARKLLAEAGYPNGGFTLTMYTLQGDSLKLAVAEVLQGELAKLGIKARVIQQTYAAVTKRAADFGRCNFCPEQAYDMIILYKAPDVWDPWTFLARLFHSTSRTDQSGQWNFMYYENREVDRLVDEALRTGDERKRTELWRKANHLVAQDVPAVFAHRMVNESVHRKDLKGYVFRRHTGKVYMWYELSR